MNIKKMTFLTSIGSGLEYYDFIMYGLLSTYLGKVFFPTSHDWIGIAQALSLFAIGYLARPIGGLLFGHIGDKLGRKKSLLLSVSIMSVSTFAIGLIPGYESIGFLGTLFLIFFRLLQGLAFGAEMPGMLTFITEHAPENHKGVLFGFILSAVSLGGGLGSIIPFLLCNILTNQQMLSYGWRIPFYLGGIWSVAIFIVRNRISETPSFIAHEKARLAWPAMELLKKYHKEILSGISICLFPACLIVLGIALPAYLARFYGYSTEKIFFSVFVGAIFSLFILPLFGYLSDIFCSRRLLFLTSSIFILVGYGLFTLLKSSFLWVFFILYNTLVASLANAYLQTLVSLFPVSIRFSGVGFCYNTAYSIAGFVPLLLSLFNSNEDITFYLYSFFSLLALITLIGCFSLRHRSSSSEKISCLPSIYSSHSK